MTAFVTEVQLGVAGTGFTMDDIAAQEHSIRARRLDVQREENNPLRHAACATARLALLQMENRLALMHLHNRLRALEGR